MRKVLLDFDGVLINMLDSLRRTLADEGLAFKPEKVETYDFHGDIGCDRENVLRCLNHIAVYSNAGFYDGAEDAVRELRGVAEVHAYTSVPPNPFVMSVRSKLIDTLGLKGQIYVGEKPVLGGFDALFEDCADTVRKYEGSLDVYLINHTYNLNEQFGEKVYRFNSFVEAVKSFCSKC